jgi:uncharacterized protein YjbI with pentapeptide repeats
MLFMGIAFSLVTELVTKKTRGVAVSPIDEVGRGISRTLNNADRLAPDIAQAIDKVDLKISKIGKRSDDAAEGSVNANIDLSNQDFAGLEAPEGVYAASTFDHTNFTGALLDGASFEGAAGAEAIFKKARMAGANLNATKFTGADFTGADLRKAGFRASNLSGAVFIGADAGGASFAGAKLSNAKFNDGYAPAGSFVDAVADGVDFTGADLRSARFNYADLASADLSAADVTGADFTGAKLRGTKLASTLGLTQDQLLTACGDESTELPPGTSIYACE